MLNYILLCDGYYGKKGIVFKLYKVGNEFLIFYVCVYVIDNDLLLWKVVCGIVNDQGLGDIGIVLGKEVKVNMDIINSDFYVLFVLLDFYYVS